jgi:site-specific recombinase XerD
VLNLTVSDVDAHGQTLRIHGKGSKQRMMPLAEAVATTLRLYGQIERPKTASLAIFVVLKGAHRGSPLSMAGLR